MKISPIVFVSSAIKDENNALLRESLRQNAKKISKLIFIIPPEQKTDLSELIAKKENIDFSEKIKQFNKEIFGI